MERWCSVSVLPNPLIPCRKLDMTVLYSLAVPVEEISWHSAAQLGLLIECHKNEIKVETGLCALLGAHKECPDPDPFRQLEGNGCRTGDPISLQGSLLWSPGLRSPSMPAMVGPVHLMLCVSVSSFLHLPLPHISPSTSSTF